MIIFATQFIFNRLMAKNTSIIIKGARVNNLKNIDVEIPRNKLVVITGLSGSGRILTEKENVCVGISVPYRNKNGAEKTFNAMLPFASAGRVR